MSKEIEYWRGRAEAFEAALRLVTEGRAGQMAMYAGGGEASAPEGAVLRALRSLRPKQFAVLQLLEDGVADAEICEILDIRPETVRGHVRTVMKALRRETGRSVPRRADMMAMIGPAIGGMDPEDYAEMAGLPKDWSQLPDRSDQARWPHVFLNTVSED